MRRLLLGALIAAAIPSSAWAADLDQCADCWGYPAVSYVDRAGDANSLVLFSSPRLVTLVDSVPLNPYSCLVVDRGSACERALPARPFGLVLITLGAGDDRLEGSASQLTTWVEPGPGTDIVKLGNGHDQVHAQAAVESPGPDIDTISCGAGNDTVFADAADVVAADCEIVQRPSNGA